MSDATPAPEPMPSADEIRRARLRRVEFGNCTACGGVAYRHLDETRAWHYGATLRDHKAVMPEPAPTEPTPLRDELADVIDPLLPDSPCPRADALELADAILERWHLTPRERHESIIAMILHAQLTGKADR